MTESCSDRYRSLENTYFAEMCGGFLGLEVIKKKKSLQVPERQPP